MRYVAACLMVVCAALVPWGGARAATGDDCARLDAYRTLIERSNLTSMKKREALLRQNQAVEEREKLRNRRSPVGLDNWCRDALADLRRRDGI